MKNSKFDLVDELREAVRGALEETDSMRDRIHVPASVAVENQAPKKRSSRRISNADPQPV